jgi:phage I-like protein
MTREAERLALFSIAAELPESGSAPPEWITIFPTLGDVRTRDGRSFVVDGAELVKAFEASGIDIPIDVNHSTDNAAPRGERSDAVGWISRLRVEAGALQGKVEWLDEGRALLARRAYRYVSPSFAHKPDGRATWLKAVSLVNVPALADQSALAAASAGQTLSFLQAVEQLTAEASHAGSSGEALLSARNAGECTVHEVNDVVRRANSLIAEHKAAGLSLSFVEAVERSTKS